MMFDVHRLRRTGWGDDVDGLAQEIHAILSTLATEGIKGPLIINTTGDDPPISINVPPEYVGTPIQITKGEDQYGIPWFPTDFNPLPPPDYDPFQPTGPGNQPPDDPFTDDVPITPEDTEPAAGSPVPDPDESGNTQDPLGDEPSFMPVSTTAKIISGADKDYVIGVWLSFPGSTLANPTYMEIPAVAPQLTTGDDIDDGTMVLCTLFYKNDETHGVEAIIYPMVWL